LVVPEPFVLGWEEWLSLPELGLPAIKAKVDTGARTSALAASDVEEIGTPERPRVRFVVRPIPGRDDIQVTCMATVIDRREVTSSNGETERRYVIRSMVRMGGREWPIDITLASRSTMAYRMLLGRQAVRDDMFVDPATSFRQPQLSYRAYGPAIRSEPARRALTIALLSRRPENASNRRLVRQAEQRGHAMPVIDRRRLSLYIAAREPAILVNGLPVEPMDAIVFRAGKSPSPFSLAIVRQMEILGLTPLNSADALARSGDALVTRQMLAGAGIAVPEVAVHPTHLSKSSGGVEHMLADSIGAFGAVPVLRFAVVGGRALSVIERAPTPPLDQAPQWSATSLTPGELATGRNLAERAARTMGLGLAAVDVILSRAGPFVVDLTANVSLSLFERLTGVPLAEAVIVHIERTVEARALLAARRTEPPAPAEPAV
jgi:ribosomal protein S6--L-glutamate ligase